MLPRQNMISIEHTLDCQDVNTFLMSHFDDALANAIEAEAKAKERFDNNQIRIWDWLKFKKRVKDIEQEIAKEKSEQE